MLLHPLDMIGLPLPPAWADALGWGLATLPLTPLAVAAGAGILPKMLSSQGLKVGTLPLLLSSASVLQALTLLHPTSKWFEKQQFISPSPWESPVRYPQIISKLWIMFQEIKTINLSYWGGSTSEDNLNLFDK